MRTTRLAKSFVIGALTATSVVLSAQANTATARPMIVGGDEVSVVDYPYVVYLANAAGSEFCGGAVISRRSVVTAAHCIRESKVSQEDLRVVGGRQHPNDRQGVEASVKSVWIPVEYRTVDTGDDVAVLELDRRLPSAYRAITVTRDGARALTTPGTMATVLGWGRTSATGAHSGTLRAVTLPISDDRTCAATFVGYRGASMLCAGYPSGGKDACAGDSGGPLVVGDTLVGIVSAGPPGAGCAQPGEPGLYTRASAFANDIAGHAVS